MSDRVISIYALDSMLAKLSGMYHIEDIRAMISKMPSAEIETEKPEWISVRERLPKDGEKVAVILEALLEAPIIAMAEYLAVKDDWGIMGAGMLSEQNYWRVTHWMPLPAPPK